MIWGANQAQPGQASPGPGQPGSESWFFFRRPAGAERVMIFFAGPAWAGTSHDFFFAGPAWAGAIHDFFSQGRPGPGRVMISFAGPARAEVRVECYGIIVTT